MTAAVAPVARPVARPELLSLLGRTPVVRVTAGLPDPHPGFWAKLEGLAAGGMKARPAVSMLLDARERGLLRPGAPVVESTSGTLGLGLAFAGQALGHPVVLVGDGELEPSMRRLLRAHGVRLEIVDRPAVRGGWQAARLARLRELLAELPGAYWPDQYNNPGNSAGYASLAAELAVQLDHLDILVCSVGTGGHSAGIVGPLRRHWPGLRLIGVDATGSTIFGQPARPRLMRGWAAASTRATSVTTRSTRCTGSARRRRWTPAGGSPRRASSAAAGAPAPWPVSPPGRPASTRARSSRPFSPTVRTATSAPSTTTTSPPRTASTSPPRPHGPWRSRTRGRPRPPAGCAAPVCPIR